MSTIGHPLSDLVNLATPYFLLNQNLDTHLPAFQPSSTEGLPELDQLIKWYAEVAGWNPKPDLTYGISFGFFRATCIYQGIAARWAVRQASSAEAKQNAEARHTMGQVAWETIKRAIEDSKDRAKLWFAVNKQCNSFEEGQSCLCHSSRTWEELNAWYFCHQTVEVSLCRFPVRLRYYGFASMYFEIRNLYLLGNFKFW